MTSRPISTGDILDILVKIQHGVGAADVKKSLDPDVLGKLGTALQYARTNEEFWQTNRDTADWMAFAMYHAWRNVALVLDAMKSRIGQAGAGDGDAEKRAAANLFPSLLSLVNLLHDTVPALADREEISSIMGGVAQLRASARRCNMIPSLEQELAGVDKEDLLRHLDKLAEAVTAKRAVLRVADKR